MAKSLKVVMDPNLSWEAKGLMYEIEFYGDSVRRQLAGAAGQVAPEIESALIELFTAGYIGSEWLWMTVQEDQRVIPYRRKPAPRIKHWDPVPYLRLI